MYVHIGEEILVRTTNIIVILDKQSVNLSQIRENNKIEKTTAHLADKNVKSVIITKNKTYLSSIASVTLKKRCRISSFQEFNNDFLAT